jgi:hypothetical protein
MITLVKQDRWGSGIGEVAQKWRIVTLSPGTGLGVTQRPLVLYTGQFMAIMAIARGQNMSAADQTMSPDSGLATATPSNPERGSSTLERFLLFVNYLCYSNSAAL